jgi:hypothetical protein
MRRLALIAVVLSASGALLAPRAVSAADETRQLVKLPDMMRQHLLGNMRDHLLALNEIQEALATGAFDRAAQIAETRLGLSSLNSHGASHMAPLMPAAMREIGTGMHQAASRFATLTQEASVDGDLKRPLAALAKVTGQCNACHAVYRVH